MGLLDKLLGTGKKEPAIKELKFEEVEPFVEKEAREKEKVIKKEVPAKFSEIKHLIHETKDLLEDLEEREISEEGNKRFRKAAKTAKRDSIKKMDSVLKKIQPPFTEDTEKIRSYVFESLSLLRKKIRSSAKSLAYTGVVLKGLMKEIGKRIDALEHAFTHLVELIKQNLLLFEKKKLLNRVSEVKDKRRELKKTRLDLNKLNSAVEEIEKNKVRIQKELEKLLESSDSAQLRALEKKRENLSTKKSELKNKLINMVAGINRPLKKLQNAVEKEKYFLEEESKQALKLFLDDPIKLFKRNPKAKEFKQLLKELKGTIVSEKIQLKEREKEKTLNEIDELLDFDFFSNFFWKENELEKEIKEIDKKEESIEVKSKMDRLKRNITELEHDLKETSTAIKELQRKEKQLVEEAQESINSLSSMLSKMTGKKIQIIENSEPKEKE